MKTCRRASSDIYTQWVKAMRSRMSRIVERWGQVGACRLQMALGSRHNSNIDYSPSPHPSGLRDGTICIVSAGACTDNDYACGSLGLIHPWMLVQVSLKFRNHFLAQRYRESS